MKKQLSRCKHCERSRRGVKKRRLNTNYADDKHNYTTCCMSCFKEIWEYYEERWTEYYSTRL